MPIDYNNKDSLRGSLFSSPGERQGSIDQLLRSIGSLNAQSLNSFRDSAGANGTPLATQLAQERGLAIRGNQQATQGINDITRFFGEKDQSAARFILNQMFQKDAQKSSQRANREQSLLSTIGGVGEIAGLFLGGGV